MYNLSPSIRKYPSWSTSHASFPATSGLVIHLLPSNVNFPEQATMERYAPLISLSVCGALRAKMPLANTFPRIERAALTAATRNCRERPNSNSIGLRA
jgi:hypothetical protein